MTFNSSTIRKYDRLLTRGSKWGLRGHTIFPQTPTTRSPEDLGELYGVNTSEYIVTPREIVMRQFHKMLYSGELDKFMEKRYRRF